MTLSLLILTRLELPQCPDQFQSLTKFCEVARSDLNDHQYIVRQHAPMGSTDWRAQQIIFEEERSLRAGSLPFTKLLEHGPRLLQLLLLCFLFKGLQEGMAATAVIFVFRLTEGGAPLFSPCIILGA